MNVIFIGCVEFSYELLITIHEETSANIVGIVSKEDSGFNSDFKSLIPFAKKNNIPFMSYENNEQLSEWIKKINYEVIYCFGWSHLLPNHIMETAKLGTFGYHPAELPKNRGRHPIIWSLVLGLEQTGSTFFLMDKGADSGDIVSQVSVKITQMDKARDLYAKLLHIAKKQVIDITEKIISRSLVAIQQDDSKANYWRKRTKQDGFIDWRMSSLTIYNLVRGLSEPYVGAHCNYKGKEIKIWDVSTEVSEQNHEFQNLEPGKVVRVFQEKNSLIIKTGDNIIEVLRHEFIDLPEEGEYIL